jgi:hypothetical protein
MSVYTDRITEGLFRILEKKKQVDDVEVFGGDFTDGLTEGFKWESPYSDMTPSPSKFPMESPMEYFCR